MSARLRLFAAVPIPHPQLEALERTLAPLRARLPEARWIPSANQHVTLKFLGWVDESLVPAVGEAVAGVAARHAPGPVAIRGLGAFPSERRARVVWAGLDDPRGLLGGLARDLDAAVVPLGFEPENREFRPHLTLARLRRPGTVAALTSVQVDMEIDAFLVKQMVVYRSHLSPKGARYEAMGTFPLSNRSNRNP